MYSERVEGSINFLERADVLLLEGEVWNLALVHLLHLLDDGKADVDVGQVLAPVFVNLFAQS